MVIGSRMVRYCASYLPKQIQATTPVCVLVDFAVYHDASCGTDFARARYQAMYRARLEVQKGASPYVSGGSWYARSCSRVQSKSTHKKPHCCSGLY